MSAPNTNLEKQEERHKGPLLGMSLGIVFAALILLGLVVFLFMQGDDADDAQVLDGPQATEEITEGTEQIVEDENDTNEASPRDASENPSEATGEENPVVDEPGEVLEGEETDSDG